jgi:hypothetical protein
VFTPVYRAFDSRRLVPPKEGIMEVRANIIPDIPLVFNSSERNMALIDGVQQLPPHLKQRISVGLTDFDPAQFGEINKFLDVLTYLEHVDPQRQVQIHGMGEFNLQRKEAVMYLLNESEPFSWQRPQSMQQFFGYVNRHMPGFAATVHMDAGPALEFGLSGRRDGLLIHAPIEYTGARDFVAFVNGHPNVNFIWAHGGGISRSGYPSAAHAARLERLLDQAPNLYVDMSWDTVADKVVAQPNAWAGPRGTGVMNRYPDRFLYGSDSVAPASIESYRSTLTVYEKSGMLQNLTNRDAFLRDNALRLASQGITGITNYRTNYSQTLLNRQLPKPWVYGLLDLGL